MRYVSALLLALTIGAAASLYTPAARAAGVYLGVGLAAPVFAAPVAAGIAACEGDAARHPGPGLSVSAPAAARSAGPRW